MTPKCGKAKEKDFLRIHNVEIILQNSSILLRVTSESKAIFSEKQSCLLLPLWFVTISASVWVLYIVFLHSQISLAFKGLKLKT